MKAKILFIIPLLAALIMLPAMAAAATAADEEATVVPVAEGEGTSDIKYLAAAIAFAGGAIGAGIAVAIAGSSAISSMTERPEMKVWGLIITSLGEAIAIYGFVIAYLILTS